MKHQLELISFNLCPYVQRAVVALKKKKADYKITYIDLANPPDWFTAISPLGQVPVLKVDEKHVIFESAVINEFLDETIEPRFHLADPVLKAKERAWIEYGSALLGEFSSALREKDLKTARALEQEFLESLERVEPILEKGPYFRGSDFSLVDASYAPIFFRMKALPEMFTAAKFAKMPKVKAWAEALLALPEVKDSVIPEFRELFIKRMQGAGSALLANAS